MKRPLQLSLAIALALSGTNAFALGLGTIHVNSKLNQPLDADIPVTQGTAGEAEGLIVQLAAAEDFDRVGLNRSRLSVPLEFSLVKGGSGQLSIKVTSKEVVREPFLDFLVEANWPKGRLLREYTVLLDPPVMAPATGTTAVAVAPKAPPRATTQPLPETKPAPVQKARPAPVAAAPRSETPSTKPAPTTAPSRASASGEYTIQSGDTLSAIARETRPDESTNLNQMMLALLKQNPNAFYKNNINALKRGAILRIPSADDVKSVGSASAAAAEVHTQIEDWRGGAASKPTLVADTGAALEAPAKTPKASPSTGGTSSTSKSANERLELVPPKGGRNAIAMNDRPGNGTSGAGAAEVKAELARTKEALTSREQEAGELKSRVKELEDTKSKSDRLLTLKDSEIADLQRKLKDLQGAKSTATTTPSTSSTTPSSSASTSSTAPSSTPATTPKDAKVSKEDIWGQGATGADKSGASSTPSSSTSSSSTSPSTPPSATSTTSSTTTSTTPSTATGTTMPTSGTATTPPSSSTTPSTATTSTTPSTTAPSTSASTPSTTPVTTDTTSSATPTTGSTTPPTSTTPSSTTPPNATTTPPVTPSPKPATTKPKPVATPVSTTAMPWYEQSWVKPAAIGAAALLLLAGLLGMRKKKTPPPAARGSIAGAFADSPLGGGVAASGDAEEQSLREQLGHDPANLGLHLELLSLLYAERRIDAFEEAAATMHTHVVDAHQPEWLEARAMGQELAPHNPLFADTMPAHDDAFDDEHDGFDDAAVTARHDLASFDEATTAQHELPSFDHDEVFGHRREEETFVAPPVAPERSDFDFEFNREPTIAEPGAPPPATPAHETSFSFDNLPPLDFAKEAQHEIEPAIEPEPLTVDEDEFAGEDGVGTKLDLAKAYLDMGDPEGARSMLEEVLAEGSDAQKGEARKLMEEIR